LALVSPVLLLQFCIVAAVFGLLYYLAGDKDRKNKKFRTALPVLAIEENVVPEQSGLRQNGLNRILATFIWTLIIGDGILLIVGIGAFLSQRRGGISTEARNVAATSAIIPDNPEGDKIDLLGDLDPLYENFPLTKYTLASGASTILVQNPLNVSVLIKVKKGNSGLVAQIPPRGNEKFQLRHGSFDIYLIRENDLQTLYRGTGFTLEESKQITISTASTGFQPVNIPESPTQP
jgi:hypothetical protein